MVLDLVFNDKTISLIQGTCNSVGKDLAEMLNDGSIFNQSYLGLRGICTGCVAFEVYYGKTEPRMDIHKGDNVIIISSNGNIMVLSNEESQDNRLMNLKKYSKLDYANYVLELGKSNTDERFFVLINSNDSAYLDYFSGADNVFAYGIVE